MNNEMANRMSLFYAEATPMLKTLSNATTKFVSEVSAEVSEEQKRLPSGVPKQLQGRIHSRDSCGGAGMRATPPPG